MILKSTWKDFKSIAEDWKTLKPKKEELDDQGQPIHIPNKRTIRAFKDSVEGRMIKIESVDEFFKELDT